MIAIHSGSLHARDSVAPQNAGEIRWVDLVDDKTRKQLGRYDVLEHSPPGQKAIKKAFKFPDDAQDGLYGIDISHHNGKVDWSAVTSGGAKFVYIKASQGDRFRDKMFATNWIDSGKKGKIRRGAYHFLTANTSGKDQAKAYLAMLKSVNGLDPDDLAPVLDLEWDMVKVGGKEEDRWSKLTPDQIAETALEWLNAVKAATGRTPTIYTAASWWNSRMPGVTKLKDFPHWTADYREGSFRNGAPQVVKGHKQVAWQFTDGGQFPGTASKFDVNWLKHGDIKQLIGN